MLRPQGYAIVMDPDARNGVAQEIDSITCAHCQRVQFVKPGTGATVYLIPATAAQLQRGAPRFFEEMGACCALCGHKPICLECHDRGGCTPWLRRIEQIEARDRLLRAVAAS